jgi:hypothetical protein
MLRRPLVDEGVVSAEAGVVEKKYYAEDVGLILALMVKAATNGWSSRTSRPTTKTDSSPLHDQRLTSGPGPDPQSSSSHSKAAIQVPSCVRIGPLGISEIDGLGFQEELTRESSHGPANCNRLRPIRVVRWLYSIEWIVLSVPVIGTCWS